MEDAREARRKRLIETKSSRLALITGQNQNLAQSAPPQHAASGEDQIATETPKNYREGFVINTLDNSSKQDPDLKPDTSLPHMFEVESENHEVEEKYVSTAQKNEVVSNEHNRSRSEEDISGKLFTTSMLNKPEDHGSPRATNNAQKVVFAIFTPRNISHSVSATENIRLFFTFVMAILMVSSYNGFMIGGRFASSIMNFRPLFLVLLTDVIIILGWLFLNQGISQKPENDAWNAMQEGWPNNLSKLLEIGKVLHKLLGAAFMDCSICAIFIICGMVG